MCIGLYDVGGYGMLNPMFYVEESFSLGVVIILMKGLD
jgi:hypothetical protein